MTYNLCNFCNCEYINGDNVSKRAKEVVEVHERKRAQIVQEEDEEIHQILSQVAIEIRRKKEKDNRP